MRYLSEIFWRHFWDVGTLFPNNFEFLVCLSVCQLAYFLTEIRQIQGYLKFWMRYISHFSWRYSWDVSTLTRNDSEFHVCLSICLFAYFLTKIRQRDISGSGWCIFLEFFGGIPDMLVHWFQIIQIFCLSVSLVVGILPYRYQTDLGISPALDEISF